MTSFRLLVQQDFVPAAEAMCAAMAVPCAVVSEKAAWDRPQHCLLQIDLPRLHARVLGEVARQRGISLEALLLAWIDRVAVELARQGAGSPGGVLRRCRLLAEWEELGYSGGEPVIGEFAGRFAPN